jgi:recombination protein RecA
VVEKSGAWFSYDRSASGRDVKIPRTICANIPKRDRIENAIRAQTEGLAGDMMAGPEAEDDA